jgi:hypothetical protein
MSTNTYPDSPRTRTADRPRAGARPTRPRTDPWRTDEDDSPSANAPRTFDPSCTRRLRNLWDEENAATPP